MSSSVMYNVVRSRQLEGTFPGSPRTGYWITTSCRVQKGWGSVEDELWPYEGGEEDPWPPVEPEGLDLPAKSHRILAYERVSTVEECKDAMFLNKGFVSAGFEIDTSWGKPTNGRIPLPSNRWIIGKHAVRLYGYNDESQRLDFRNSWGAKWGKKGYGSLPYSYFPERFIEGWSYIGLDSRPLPISSNTEPLKWEIKDLFGNILHGVEIIDPIENEMIGWGFAVELEESLELEELFVRPNWRRRGYGSKLATEFYQIGIDLEKPLRAWIPHSDDEKGLALNKILQRLGLSRQPSPERWAAAIGIKLS